MVRAAIAAAGAIMALALLYRGTRPPTLLALADRARGALRSLLEALRSELPPRLYAHLSPELLPALAPRYAGRDAGEYLKLVLLEAPPLSADVAGPPVARLGRGDVADMTALYARSYPQNWFDPDRLGAVDLERRSCRRAACLAPNRRAASAARGKAGHLKHQGFPPGTREPRTERGVRMLPASRQAR
jgi:hypothetical protein